MVIKPHHIAAVQVLVAEQFEGQTQEQLAAKMGVRARTLYRWLQDPGFLAVLAAAQAEWRADIDHLPYVHRRRRLEELVRLYEVTPDDYVDKVIDIIAPHPKSGEMVRESVPVRKMNVAVKARILEQIALEVGGDVAQELEALKIALGMVDGRPTLRVAATATNETG